MHSVRRYLRRILLHQFIKAFRLILKLPFCKICISLFYNFLFIFFIADAAFLSGKHIIIIEVRQMYPAYTACS